MEFPELKDLAMEEYSEWEPDAFIVEKKSAGTALYQEMRRMGLPVQEYTPHRGSGDKLARLNSVTDIVASGFCWVPDPKRAGPPTPDEIIAKPSKPGNLKKRTQILFGSFFFNGEKSQNFGP